MKKLLLILFSFLFFGFISNKKIKVKITGYYTPTFNFSYVREGLYKHKQELFKRGKSYTIYTSDYLVCEKTKLEGFSYLQCNKELFLTEQIKGCLKQSTYNAPVDNKGYVLVPYQSIAADPKVIPRNSIVRIGNWFTIAHDIGDAIKGNTIDVYMGTDKQRADTTLFYTYITVEK